MSLLGRLLTEDFHARLPGIRGNAMTANVATINLSDGRVVTTSYGVPVAVFAPGQGHLKTDRKYSVTSSRHAGLYARQNGSQAREIPHADFRLLVAPIETEA